MKSKLTGLHLTWFTQCWSPGIFTSGSFPFIFINKMLKLLTIHNSRTPLLQHQPTLGFQRSMLPFSLPSSLPSFCPLSEWECLCFSLKHICIFPGGLLPSQWAYIISTSTEGPVPSPRHFWQTPLGDICGPSSGRSFLRSAWGFAEVSGAHLGIKLYNCRLILGRSHRGIFWLAPFSVPPPPPRFLLSFRSQASEGLQLPQVSLLTGTNVPVSFSVTRLGCLRFDLWVCCHKHPVVLQLASSAANVNIIRVTEGRPLCIRTYMCDS